MTSKELIIKLEQIFSKEPSLEQRYYYELDWLNTRKHKWASNKIRVGFIGVTSSGKSTLLNAILGEEILSMAVRPSSNQIVSCYKSEKNSAEIILQGGKNVILSGKKFSEKNLRMYCDEGTNKNNKEKVEEIRLSTSKFDFEEDVVFLDSAGLDAFKLESHERLTLEVLLPTIDICVLVSTLMGSSDEKVRMVLKAIDKYHIPIIVVQNMLDSVEPSADGSKNSEMVAEDHRKRMQRIIDNSNIKNKDMIQIVQISARQAMEARSEGKEPPVESKYADFKSSLKSILDDFRPLMDQERVQSVLRHYEEFLKQEKKIVGGQPTKLQSFEHEGLLEDIKKQVGKTMGKMNRIIEALDVNSNQKLPKFDSSMSEIFLCDDMDKLSSLASAYVAYVSNLIIDQINDFNEYIEKVCDKINVPSRDLIYEPHAVPVPEPKVYYTQILQTTRQKKRGFIASVARFLGDVFGQYDWGYEDVVDGVSEQVDAQRTKTEIKEYILKSRNMYGNEMRRWKENIKTQIEKIKEEYDKLEGSYRLRKEKSIEMATVKGVIEQVSQELKNVKKSITPIQRKKKSNIKSVENQSQEMSEMIFTGYQRGLLHYSRELLKSISIGYLCEIRKREKYPLKSIICGWDELSIQDVGFRFFDKCVLEQWQQEGENIILMNPTFEKIKDQLGRSACSIYVLINAQQDGSAKNQISKLKLNKLVRKKDRVFFVVQDFNNLLLSHGISEMRINLQEYYSDFGIEQNHGLILINADNPVYCMAYVESQLEPCGSKKEEREFIEKLQNNFPELMSESVKSAIDELIRVK